MCRGLGERCLYGRNEMCRTHLCALHDAAFTKSCCLEMSSLKMPLAFSRIMTSEQLVFMQRLGKDCLEKTAGNSK